MGLFTTNDATVALVDHALVGHVNLPAENSQLRFPPFRSGMEYLLLFLIKKKSQSRSKKSLSCNLDCSFSTEKVQNMLILSRHPSVEEN